MNNDNKIFIISVGGSLICPDRIDITFLKKFREIIIKHVHQGKRFVIITGGGRTSRNYQVAASEVAPLDDEDLDWIGIHGTRINAHLIKTMFREFTHEKIIKDPTLKIDFKDQILVAAGWKPGHSTDFVAVTLAKNLGIKIMVNLTNVDYVYDKDPFRFKDAKPFKNMKWKDFRKMFGEKWSPGLNTPFDPVAGKEAEASSITVCIINGANLENLDSVLEGKEFVGTTIS